MSDTPKRRFWQLRLSTAVVLMFVAFGLVGANLHKRAYDYKDWGGGSGTGTGVNNVKEYRPGWPWPVRTGFHATGNKTRFIFTANWLPLNIALNAGVAVACLFLATRIQNIIRRRKSTNRKWFQIHLSTAIVLMLLTGGLMALNTRQTRTTEVMYGGGGTINHDYYGWPYDALRFSQIETYNSSSQEVYYADLMLNLWIAIAVLAATLLVCEEIVCPREAREP